MPANPAYPDVYCPLCGTLCFSPRAGPECPNPNCLWRAPQPEGEPQERDEGGPQRVSAAPAQTSVKPAEVEAPQKKVIPPRSLREPLPPPEPSLILPKPVHPPQGTVEVPAQKRVGIYVIAVMCLVIVAFTAGYFIVREQGTAVPPKVKSPITGRGTIRVIVNVPARGSLDEWDTPDGQPDQPSTTLVFSNVLEGSHRLSVWAGSRKDSRKVSVRSGETNEVKIELPPY